MRSQSGTLILEVEQIRQVTLVRVVHRPLAPVEYEESLGTALLRLLGDAGRPLVVLNLGALPLLGSSLLGNLLTFRKAVLARGGRLALCHVSAAIQEALAVVKLSRLFSVYENEELATQVLEQPA